MSNYTTKTDNKFKENDAGALWKKKSKDEQKPGFLCGKIKLKADTSAGTEIPIIIFANTYKEQGSAQPDFRIYFDAEFVPNSGSSDAKPKKEVKKTAAAPDPFEDDPSIPF